MTAEEFLNEWYYDFDCIIEQDNQYTGEYQQDYAAEVMEAYAKQKVLEALESEFSKVKISLFDEDRSLEYIENGQFYFKTYIEPKYK